METPITMLKKPKKKDIQRDFQRVVDMLSSVHIITQSEPALSALNAAKRLQDLYQQGRLAP